MSDATQTWPDLAVGLYDKLTGRGAEIRYQFENLEVMVPASASSDTQRSLPKATWKLNGSIRISTQDNRISG